MTLPSKFVNPPSAINLSVFALEALTNNYSFTSVVLSIQRNTGTRYYLS